MARFRSGTRSLFQDPFGRWIIEDLGSHNGIWIDGHRTPAKALVSGECVSIGPFSLTLSDPLDRQIAADARALTTHTSLSNDVDTRVIPGSPGLADRISGEYLRWLNEITDRLNACGSTSNLYPEVCRSLVRSPDGAALVLRLPRGDDLLSESPEVPRLPLPGESERGHAVHPGGPVSVASCPGGGSG